MAPFRSLALLLATASAASAFTPAATPFAARSSVATTPSSLNYYDPAIMTEAQADWEEKHPQLAEWGWGPTVLAEKWNGRHAMFGWFFIVLTAYAKGHGLIPNADAPVDLKTWGMLATISGKNTLTNERAIILVANIHAFAVGLMATIAPAPWADPLLLDPAGPDMSSKEAIAKYARATYRNKNPYGFLPEPKLGLTEEAEIINGRLAMLGLITVLGASAIEGKSILDVVNEWTGGAYY